MSRKNDVNREERMRFVRLWADYVKTHPDRDWSEQQRVLIDSQMKNARNYLLSKEKYLEIKKAAKDRNCSKEQYMEQISFDEWKRLELRVGEVVKAERVPKTERLYRLQIDIGSEKAVQKRERK